jgi:hypothetical protein
VGKFGMTISVSYTSRNIHPFWVINASEVGEPVILALVLIGRCPRITRASLGTGVRDKPELAFGSFEWVVSLGTTRQIFKSLDMSL